MDKFKTLSADNMYKYFLQEKVEGNNSFIIKNKKLYYSSDKEIEVINRQIETNKNEYYNLIEKDNKTPQELNEISDLEISLTNFEKRRKELINDIKKVKFVLDFILFKKILTIYNTKAGDRIINGDKLNLLNSLGYIVAKRIERTFNTKTVNWGETNKLRDSLTGELPINISTGKKKLIYFVDDEYCRVGWEKVHGIKNLSVYGFEPTGGQPGKGYRQKFSKANIDNKLLKLKYKYYAIDDGE